MPIVDGARRSAATCGFSWRAGLFSAKRVRARRARPICSFICASRRQRSGVLRIDLEDQLADRDRLDEEAVLRVALGRALRTPRSRSCCCRAGDRSRPRAWPTARRAARAARARGTRRARACACRRRWPPPLRRAARPSLAIERRTISAIALASTDARRSSEPAHRRGMGGCEPRRDRARARGPRRRAASPATTPRSELVTNSSSAARSASTAIRAIRTGIAIAAHRREHPRAHDARAARPASVGGVATPPSTTTNRLQVAPSTTRPASSSRSASSAPAARASSRAIR